MNANPEQELHDADPAWLRKVAAGAAWISAGLVCHLIIEVVTGTNKLQPTWLFAVDVDSFVLLPGIAVAVAGVVGGWMVTAPEPGGASGGRRWWSGTLARVLVTTTFLWVAVLMPLRMLLALPWNLYLVGDVGLALGLLAGAALAARLRRLVMRLPSKALAVETRILGWVLGILAAVLIVPAMGSFQLSDDGWVRNRPWRFDDDVPPAGWILLIWMAVLAMRCWTALDKRREQEEAAADKDSRLPRGRIHFGRTLLVTGISVVLSVGLLGAVAWWSSQQIERLTSQLQHEDPELREEAMRRFHPYGRGSVAPLVAALLDEDPEVRRQVARWGSHSLFNGAGRSAVPALIEVLHDPEARLRRWGALPPIDLVKSHESTPAFFMALRNSQRKESKLRDDPELLAALNAALEDEDLMIRYYASEALGRRKEFFSNEIKPGSAGEQLRSWTGHLKHDDPQVRLWAAFYVGRKNRATTPVFIELLKHENKWVREWAATELRLWEPAAVEAAPALVQALADEHVRVNYEAARALFKFGRKGGIWEDSQLVEAAVSKLVDILEDDTKRFAWEEAAYALGGIGPAAKDAIPTLVRKLDRSRGPWWSPIALALQRIGLEQAAEVVGLIDAGTEEPVPALVEVLTGGEGRDRLRAAKFLGLYGGKAEPAVPALIEALDEDELADAAAGALVRIGPAAAAALQRVVQDRDSPVREEAVSTLGAMSLVSNEMIEVLAGALVDEDDAVALAAAKAFRAKHLHSSSAAVTKVNAVLRQLLGRDDRLLRVRAVAVLRQQGSERPEPLVAVLIEALDHEDAVLPAVDVLAKFGPQASAAVPALLEAARDTEQGTPARQAIVRVIAMTGDQDASIEAAKMK